MKKFLSILFTLFAVSTMVFAKADRRTVVFDVDLHCQGCVNKIQNNIAYEKGMIDLRCDLDRKQVTVVFDANKTSVEKLQSAFAKIKKTATVNPDATKAVLSAAKNTAMPDATSAATVTVQQK